MTQYDTHILANSEPLGLKVTRYYDWQKMLWCYKIELTKDLEQHQFCVLSDILHHIREEVINPNSKMIPNDKR
jgi:hypothetical protein